MDMAEDYIQNYKDYGDLIPSIAGLAVLVRVSREQIHEWRKNDVDARFSNIYDELMSAQERALLAGGLSKAFSGTITALVLSKHGYSNKTDVTNSDGSLRPQVTEVVRRVVSKNDNQ